MPGLPTEADAATAKLVANFLRQLAGCDWSGAELRELADLVEAGQRRIVFDPDFFLHRDSKCTTSPFSIS